MVSEAEIRRIFRKNKGKLNRDAVLFLQKHVVQHLSLLVESSLRRARHFGRKMVRREDIEQVLAEVQTGVG
jgi:histone H3/H4